MMILVLLLFSSLFFSIKTQGGTCSTDSQCPTGQGSNLAGGTCFFSSCKCYIGYFGSNCQFGNYSIYENILLILKEIIKF